MGKADPNQSKLFKKDRQSDDLYLSFTERHTELFTRIPTFHSKERWQMSKYKLHYNYACPQLCNYPHVCIIPDKKLILNRCNLNA